MGMDSLVDFLVAVPPWVTVFPIIVCSIISLAIVIERSLFYRRLNLDYRLIIENVTAQAGKKNIDGALASLAAYRGPVVTVIGDILHGIKIKADRQLSIIEAARHGIATIERYTATIATIATISPMLGLLGTVTGLLKGFTALYRMGAGTGATNMLALGVSEALITTVLGLLVAIPSWIFYNYMLTRIEYYIKEIEYVSNTLVKL